MCLSYFPQFVSAFASPQSDLTQCTACLTLSQAAGFLVLPEFVTKEQLEAVKQRANEIVQEFDPAEVAIFSTTKQVGTEHLQGLV